MRRLPAVACAFVVVLITPGVASAQCIELPGQRADRLANIAAGHVSADVAFIGKVVDRHEVVRHGKGIGTAVEFRVVATFKGSALHQRTVLLNSGCFNGTCTYSSEEQQFRGHRFELVFANHRKVGLVSASTCTDAGPLTTSEVALMLHPSTLPMTGGQQLSGIIWAGMGALLLGGGMLALSHRRRITP